MQRFSTGATISLNLADAAARTRTLQGLSSPTRYSGRNSVANDVPVPTERQSTAVYDIVRMMLNVRGVASRHAKQSSPTLCNLANEINPNPAPRRFRLNQFRGNSRRVPEIKSAYTAAGACRHARLNGVQCYVFLHVQTTLPPVACLRPDSHMI